MSFPWDDPAEVPAGDIEGQLFLRRHVLLRSALDHGAAATLCPKLMLLDAEGDTRIDLTIDSAGGDIDAALAVIDVIGLLGVPVTATCVGRADGPAIAVLAACDHRRAAPHALLRFRYDDVAVSGSVADVQARVRWLRQQRDALTERLVASTLLTPEAVELAFDTRQVLTPAEALRDGVIDEIAAPSGRPALHRL